MGDYLLEIKDLGKYFKVKSDSMIKPHKNLIAVDHLTLNVKKGETLGLVGESGCGKTTLGRMICRLEEPSYGGIYLDGQALHSLSGEALRQQRHRFQLVFQDPLNSLNPRINVYNILAETVGLRHQRQVTKEEIMALLARVGLGPELINRYAHQLSGGQRQRLGIARALALEPEIIVADEPVSSLDVSIQAQVLNLFSDLQKQLNLTMLFISHDLRVINHLVDTVAVMYLGRLMEIAPIRVLFENPKHPYTQALLAALPRLKPGRGRTRSILKGDIPSPIDPPEGCRFYSRCSYREEDCLNYRNELLNCEEEHRVACIHWEKIEKKTR